MRRAVICLVALLIGCSVPAARAAEPPAAGGDKPHVGKLPHIEFDAQKKQVRVECEMLACDAPLEFFCCVKGTNDYEAMIRSEIKPSNLHLALLAIGLKPGQPIQYSEAAKKWLPPGGPPLQITMEYEKDGKTVSVPSWKWMRDVKTKKPAPPFTWVFTGSRVLPDGKYAADMTGYLVSIVNFDLTVVDIPKLASSSNDLLEWERNPDTTPKAGTKVTMVIEPVGAESAKGEGGGAPPVAAAPMPAQPKVSTPSLAPATQPVNVESDLRAAEQAAAAERKAWEDEVARHRDAMREAAEAHYRIMQALRTQQQKLIDEADRMQQTIDELEKQYQDLTTPRPEANGK
ncbi:MAG TPA: YdjY domain-containing protein [Tepidisphaeraceae bacterium]|jgi:hypothetical protein